MKEAVAQTVVAARTRVSGWIKTLLGTLAGVISGALVMYLSPLVDRAIRPTKPVANFAIEHTGLTVTFQNRSSGGGQARWDFGDGSPLEFVPAEQQVVTHTYPKPGTYTAKLVMTNVLGEENERGVTIDLSEAAAPRVVEKPAIVDFYVRPPGKVGQPVYAPATFQFEATADHTQAYVWDFGDGNGVQMGDYQATHTYERPGTYTIKLCAFNGKQRSVQESTVVVQEPPAGALSVNLQVADQGKQVETRRRLTPVSQSAPLAGGKRPAAIEAVVAASPGFEIVAIEPRQSQNQNLEKTSWQIAADRRSVKVVGRVLKTVTGTTAVLNEQAVIVEQRKVKASRDPVPVVTTLTAPGSTTIRLPMVPEDWSDVQRRLSLQILQNEKPVWQGATLPQNVPVVVGGRPYLLTTAQTGDKVQIELVARVAGR